ncbi:MAG: DUF5106 domain-containing protein, partial [Tannerella sp.]|nr:DUF5106 domain-containing protein [Tannerella sp.]
MDTVMAMVTEMKKSNVVLVWFIIILIGMAGCKNAGNSAAGQTEQDDAGKVVTEKFKPPDIPVMITDPNLRLEYFVRHYWDHFDFADTTYIPTPEITEQAWANYIDLLSRMP